MTAGAAPACLLVAHTMPPIAGGSCVVYDNLARLSGGAVSVLTSYRHYRTAQEIPDWATHDTACGYPITRIPLVRPRTLPKTSRLGSIVRLIGDDLPIYGRLLWAIARLSRRTGARVLCLGDFDTTGWLIPLAQRLLGLKTVIYSHGDEVSTQIAWPGVMTRRRRYLGWADAIVAVSNFNRDTLVSRFDVDPAKVEVIANGVDPEKFTPQSKDAALVARYGLTGKRVLVTVSRLVERKGVDQAIRAVGHLRDRLPDLHYLVVGDGDDRGRLEALVDTLDLADRVTFAGEVSHHETPRYYALGDIFVMPNRELPNGNNEGFGLVFLEANGCGRPVIAGRAGGAVDAVHDGTNGLTVDGTDDQAVAAAIDRLFGDPVLYDRLRAGGLDAARQNSWPRRAEQFAALCRRLTVPH